MASTDGFDSSGGTFAVDLNGSTTPTTCTYGGISGNQFTSVAGCTGSVAASAAVNENIDQTGAAHEINFSGVQLIYDATVDFHGNSTITASGNVTLSSSVDVTATASANANLGNWISGHAYSKGDVVIDTNDGNRYDAKNAITSSTAPDADSTNWEVSTSKDSSVAAAVVVASAQEASYPIRARSRLRAAT